MYVVQIIGGVIILWIMRESKLGWVIQIGIILSWVILCGIIGGKGTKNKEMTHEAQVSEDDYTIYRNASKAEAKGNIDQAIDLYNQLLQKYPDSENARAAKISIDILERIKKE